MKEKQHAAPVHQDRGMTRTIDNLHSLSFTLSPNGSLSDKE